LADEYQSLINICFRQNPSAKLKVQGISLCCNFTSDSTVEIFSSFDRLSGRSKFRNTIKKFDDHPKRIGGKSQGK